MRQSGADQGDRELPLRRLVQRADQGLELLLRQELDLVEEEHDAGLLLLGGLPQRDQQVGEVLAEFSAVRLAFERLDIDGAGDRPVRGHGDGERPQHTGRSPQPIEPTIPRRQLEHGSSDELRHPGSEGSLGRDLGIDRDPTRHVRLFGERPEQHGLADASQTRDEHRLVGVATQQTIEHHIERLEVLISAGEGSRPYPGVRRVGIGAGIHRVKFV